MYSHHRRPPSRQAALATYMAGQDVRGNQSLVMPQGARREGQDVRTPMVPSATASRSTPRSLARTEGYMRLDTEGRFASLASPAPPPGVSPSLLKVTPGRTVLNASSWYATDGSVGRGQATARQFVAGSQGEDESSGSVVPSNAIEKFEEFNDDQPLRPPPPPRFVAEPTDAARSISASTQQHATRLEKWFLTFMPTSKAGTIDPSIRNVSHWIIITGKRAKEMSASSTASSSSSRNGSPDGETEQWHSSLITERVSASLVRTGSGKVYELVGPANSHAMYERKGFSRGVALAFGEGFPKNWIAILASEARRRGFVKAGESRPGLISDTKELLALQAGIDYTHRQVGHTKLSQQPASQNNNGAAAPPEPQLQAVPLLRANPQKLEQGKRKTRTAKASRETKAAPSSEKGKAPRGVPRELRNLSKTAFGRLAVVESAMLEELDRSGAATQADASTRRSGRRSLPTKVEPQASTIQPHTPSAPRKASPQLASSRRSSERKQTSVRRWWEIAASPSDKAPKGKVDVFDKGEEAREESTRRRAARTSAPATFGQDTQAHSSPVKEHISSSSDDDVFQDDVADDESDGSQESKTRRPYKRRKWQKTKAKVSSQQGQEAPTAPSPKLYTLDEDCRAAPVSEEAGHAGSPTHPTAPSARSVEETQTTAKAIASSLRRPKSKAAPTRPQEGDFELLAAVASDEEDDDMIPNTKAIDESSDDSDDNEESTDDDDGSDDEAYRFSD